MATRAIPQPDVPRLIMRAREGGAYDRRNVRSPLERFTALWKALEYLSRPNKELEAVLERGLLRLDHEMKSTLMELGLALWKLSKSSTATFATLIPENTRGADRDVKFKHRAAVAKKTSQGEFEGTTMLLQGLRNAAVHAKMMTNDRDVAPIFVLGCQVLDSIVTAAYVSEFELTVEQVDIAFRPSV
jgi:hypothetical protein